eukprot:Colp12_sorted_trinity150504_noHs@23745
MAAALSAAATRACRIVLPVSANVRNIRNPDITRGKLLSVFKPSVYEITAPTANSLLYNVNDKLFKAEFAPLYKQMIEGYYAKDPSKKERALHILNNIKNLDVDSEEFEKKLQKLVDPDQGDFFQTDLLLGGDLYQKNWPLIDPDCVTTIYAFTLLQEPVNNVPDETNNALFKFHNNYMKKTAFGLASALVSTTL